MAATKRGTSSRREGPSVEKLGLTKATPLRRKKVPVKSEYVQGEGQGSTSRSPEDPTRRRRRPRSPRHMVDRDDGDRKPVFKVASDS